MATAKERVGLIELAKELDEMHESATSSGISRCGTVPYYTANDPDKADDGRF
jgi:hypothetical protein